MAKVTGPLFSKSASGTIGKAINFQISRGVAVVRNYFKPTYRRTALQDAIRVLFKAAADKWNEVFKSGFGPYDELGVDDLELWTLMYKGKPMLGRCGWIQENIKYEGQKWFGYPIPAFLDKILATDNIWQYEQIMADLYTLTGLPLCFAPTVFALITKKDKAVGRAYAPGLIFSIKYEHIAPDGWYYNVDTIAHELTHCLLYQHGYSFKFWNKNDHENIAYECAKRIVDGELTPIYTYKGKTLSEIVPFPGCP